VIITARIEAISQRNAGRRLQSQHQHQRQRHLIVEILTIISFSGNGKDFADEGKDLIKTQ
jgi:predicted transposase YdaD